MKLKKIVSLVGLTLVSLVSVPVDVVGESKLGYSENIGVVPKYSSCKEVEATDVILKKPEKSDLEKRLEDIYSNDTICSLQELRDSLSNISSRVSDLEVEYKKTIQDVQNCRLIEVGSMSLDVPFINYKMLNRYHQGKLQDDSITNESGYRMLGNKYVISVGKSFIQEEGVYVDLILSDGDYIRCVVGQVRDDNNNTHNLASMDIAFVVDEGVELGSINSSESSYTYNELVQEINYIKVLDKNYFNS